MKIKIGYLALKVVEREIPDKFKALTKSTYWERAGMDRQLDNEYTMCSDDFWDEIEDSEYNAEEQQSYFENRCFVCDADTGEFLENY